MTRKPRWANTWGPAVTTERLRTSDDNWRKPLVWNKEAERLNVRYRVFCASLADVFEDNPQVVDWRIDLFYLIEKTQSLDWLLLTKRPENVMDMVPYYWNNPEAGFFTGWPQNVWMGVSVENQKHADERIPHLLKIPARVRFLSCEPLLGSVILPSWDSYISPDGFENNGPMTTNLGYSFEPDNLINWVIVGGESGPKARPMHPEWARSLRDQCQAAGVAYHFKQWGEFVPAEQFNGIPGNGEWGTISPSGHYMQFTANYNQLIYRMGKHSAGRLLDGRTWDEFPK